MWLLFFAALPFINRDRMRGGDLIAGTMVISLPRKRILSSRPRRTGREISPSPSSNCGAYGTFELQVLEELLRRPDSPRFGADAQRGLRQDLPQDRLGANRSPPPTSVPFLREFYTAERAFLEREQLYGHARRQDATAATRG